MMPERSLPIIDTAPSSPNLPHCGNCKYFDEPFEESNGGLCRRYAPGWKGRNATAVWPTVNRFEWCGMHEQNWTGERGTADSRATAESEEP